MEVEGYEFTHVTDLSPLRTNDGFVQALMPQNRYKNEKNLPLNNYGGGPFCKFKIPKGYKEKTGVYVVMSGQKFSLRRRMLRFGTALQCRVWQHITKELLQGGTRDKLPTE